MNVHHTLNTNKIDLDLEIRIWAFLKHTNIFGLQLLWSKILRWIAKAQYDSSKTTFHNRPLIKDHYFGIKTNIFSVLPPIISSFLFFICPSRFLQFFSSFTSSHSLFQQAETHITHITYMCNKWILYKFGRVIKLK